MQLCPFLFCNKHLWTGASPIGSPPRAWGPLPGIGDQVGNRRFTPTGVGTTRDTAPSLPPSPVHPHGRGDHLSRALPLMSFCGSPPRAWGPRAEAMRCAFAVRFTPTGVGTTFVIRSLNSSGTVHPHGRGDHSLVCRTPDRRPGSPPRAWGPPGLHAVQNGGVRFTPTGVGTTAIIAKEPLKKSRANCTSTL